jgi:hypothetical protein
VPGFRVPDAHFCDELARVEEKVGTVVGNQTDEERASGVPEEPDLAPEETVDELERRTVGKLPEKEKDVREADAEEATDKPAIEQDVEPDERPTQEPPS